jgi:uncharacterized RDD family membrane protein YckC
MIPIERNGYGGFWIRFGAFLVDIVVLLIPTLLISFLFHAVTPARDEIERTIVDLMDSGFNLLMCWVYEAVLLSSPWQATIGKRVCGLKVTDYDGNRVSFARATGRYFAWYLSAVPLCIGFIMIAWTRQRQGLHDLMARTLVVQDSVRLSPR